MKTMMRMVGMGVALALTATVPASGQTVQVGGQACESGVVLGTLGISGLDCVGECSVTLTSEGREESWVFSTEPRIFTIQDGGPAEGILEPGDYLVAIDGLLITTREGGRRYASLEPGEVVTVRYCAREYAWKV